MKLSITRKSRAQLYAENRVGQSRHTSPDNSVARRGIAAAERGSGPGVQGVSGRREVFSRTQLGCFAAKPIDHGQPEDLPTQNAEGGNEVRQSFRSAQFGFLGFASGAHDHPRSLGPPLRWRPDRNQVYLATPGSAVLDPVGRRAAIARKYDVGMAAQYGPAGG